MGYMLSPPSSKPDGSLGYSRAAEEVLEASQAQAPHFCHILRASPRASPSSKGGRRVRLCCAERQGHVAKGQTTVTGRLCNQSPQPHDVHVEIGSSEPVHDSCFIL